MLTANTCYPAVPLSSCYWNDTSWWERVPQAGMRSYSSYPLSAIDRTEITTRSPKERGKLSKSLHPVYYMLTLKLTHTLERDNCCSPTIIFN